MIQPVVADEDKIINASKKEFGEKNFISVEYNSSNHIADVLKSLKDIKETTIAFNIVYPLQDQNGNSTDTIVIKTTYKYSSRSKINWDKFLWKNIPNTADEWWIHNAIKSTIE